MEKLKCLQKHIMRTAFAKLLTIVGKMPVARVVRMNISGIWQSINYTAQHATSLLLALARLLLVPLPVQAPAKKAVRLLLRNQLLLAKNKN